MVLIMAIVHKYSLLFYIYIYINIYIYIYISNAKSGDSGNDSILGFSIHNIHVIKNPKKSSILNDEMN